MRKNMVQSKCLGKSAGLGEQSPHVSDKHKERLLWNNLRGYFQDDHKEEKESQECRSFYKF
jgi:hypothetical protein